MRQTFILIKTPGLSFHTILENDLFEIWSCHTLRFFCWLWPREEVSFVNKTQKISLGDKSSVGFEMPPTQNANIFLFYRKILIDLSWNHEILKYWRSRGGGKRHYDTVSGWFFGPRCCVFTQPTKLRVVAWMNVARRRRHSYKRRRSYTLYTVNSTPEYFVPRNETTKSRGEFALVNTCTLNISFEVNLGDRETGRRWDGDGGGGG